MEFSFVMLKTEMYIPKYKILICDAHRGEYCSKV
jgi:hypothetical protein